MTCGYTIRGSRVLLDYLYSLTSVLYSFSDAIFQGSSSTDVIYPCTEEEHFMGEDEQHVDQQESKHSSGTTQTHTIIALSVFISALVVFGVIGIGVFIHRRIKRHRDPIRKCPNNNINKLH